MNIHQLLSTSPGSPQLQSQSGLSPQSSANSFFKQALLNASGSQSSSANVANGTGFAPPSSLLAQAGSLGDRLAEGLIGNNEDLSAALEALGINVSGPELSELLAQLQMPTPEITTEILPNTDIGGTPPLDEIAARLTLISSFSEDSRSLPTDSPVALEVVAEHLSINPTEAAHLVSALSALVVQNQSAQPLFTDKATPASIRPLPVDFNAMQRPQADNFLSHTITQSSSPQVSSEALMGSLLTVEGMPKFSQVGEPSLPGSPSSALNTNQQPLLASAQSTLSVTSIASPTQNVLSAPINSPAWSQQLGQQLVQFSQRGGEQHIQMQLNPAELGPLSISMKFSEQGAQAHFLSASAQVRQVLEQAMPQLREALAEQGISLGETSVGEQRDPNAQAFAQSGRQQGTDIEDGDSVLMADEASISRLGGDSVSLDGRVDLYA
ncbi:hypothetical protein LCGC14_0150750 [marine sediment metagenome]|uniref:Flagellar hook-length control protein-like C-terminal domain-containing protein n=1 Tax=marine sediment metagenome TaxID=412755 RepID=A0A0F9UZ06_9ZZZZ|nr:flagellar hook-length control protein FliK [Halomonas sp.]HDZ47896.1 flagellar hook-length control protein FliK [Halomonas sp.]HEB03541.1 flagellar hook-length control protein FliK [Halomonas sp.]